MIFVVWIAFILLEQKINLNHIKKLSENKDFRNVIMPYEDTEILKFNQWRKFDKEPFIVYADLKCITEKIDLCKNNPESSSITKVHLPSGFSVSTISSFWSTENKHDIYRRKSCMKKFCKSLREYAMKIINFKEKLSIKDQQESYGKGKTCYIRKEKVERISKN